MVARILTSALWHQLICDSVPCRQYNDDIEEGMDRAYEDYLKRHGQREKVAEQKRARLAKTPRGLDGVPLEEEEEASEAAAAPVQAPAHEVLPTE